MNERSASSQTRVKSEDTLKQQVSPLNVRKFEDDGRLYVSKHRYPEQSLQLKLNSESAQRNESGEA